MADGSPIGQRTLANTSTMGNTYDLVTGQILRLLERGVAPWQQPRRRSGS